MRIFSYILVAVGILMLATAGYGEYCGITRSPSGARYTIIKQSDPELFRNAMTYHWFYASMVVVAGVIAYAIDRGQEKTDPLSPDFAGNKELDDWSDAMKQEEEQRKHPK